MTAALICAVLSYFLLDFWVVCAVLSIIAIVLSSRALLRLPSGVPGRVVPWVTIAVGAVSLLISSLYSSGLVHR